MRDLIYLTPRKQRSGKVVHVWAGKGDCDPEAMCGNTFSIEWPPHSGEMQEFPEVNRAAKASLTGALREMHEDQVAFIDELERCLSDSEKE